MTLAPLPPSRPPLPRPLRIHPPSPAVQCYECGCDELVTDTRMGTIECKACGTYLELGMLDERSEWRDFGYVPRRGCGCGSRSGFWCRSGCGSGSKYRSPLTAEGLRRLSRDLYPPPPTISTATSLPDLDSPLLFFAAPTTRNKPTTRSESVRART